MAYEDLDRPPLDVRALRTALARTRWTDVRVSARTGSTNADLAALAREGAPAGTVVVTEQQTAGRGRLDRRWEQPRSSGLAVSMLVAPREVPMHRWAWLPLLTGLAVDATVRSFDVPSALKWPNDVLVDDRKLAGILVEVVVTPQGPAAVVGVGLNTGLRADELPVPTATSMRLEGASTTDRTVVLRELLRTFDALHRAWVADEGEPTNVRESYVRRCATLGRRVRVELPDGSTLEGTAETVDLEGRLVVAGQAVSAGDVTHVRAVA
jgi:BirA family biotin operon repressor/biotin-[acetyl-CoA-carboxylase] ligase